MSMPPGPPLVPSDDSIDDARDPDHRSDAADDDAAAAEALGYADPEDAPLRRRDDPEGPEGSEDKDRPEDGSAAPS